MFATLLSSVYLYTSQARVFVGLNVDQEWEDARDICSTSVTGKLATFDNDEEYSKIVEIQSEIIPDGDINIDGVWIGLSDRDEEGKWKFVDGDSSLCSCGDCDNLSQWESGQPNEFGSTGQDCAEVYGSTGIMNDNQCNKERKYICEYDIDGETVYIGFDDRKTWLQAGAACQNSISGQLATFGSDNEFRELVQISTDVGRAWIGLSDRGNNNEGKWKFIDDDSTFCGGDCDTLDQWRPGQPNDWGSGQDCAEVTDAMTDQNGASGAIQDEECNTQQSYICEFQIGAMAAVANVNNYPIEVDLTSNHDGNNYYILEFASMKDITTLISVIFNVLLLSLVCYTTIKFRNFKNSQYSKVKAYSSEDEKL